VIKVASKRAPDVLRTLFNDFEKNAIEGEYFNSYYDRKGKDHFYQLLKPIGDNSNLKEDEFFDWGSQEKFKTEIGVGECAGVIIDLVQTLFYEVEEKLAWSAEAYDNRKFGDSIYYSYAAFIHAAKGLLLDAGVHVNTHHTLIADFDKHFTEPGLFAVNGSFKELVLQINKNEPSEEFAVKFFNEANHFFEKVKEYRLKIKTTQEITEEIQ
jgi:sulfite reductase (ferredoxin)